MNKNSLELLSSSICNKHRINQSMKCQIYTVERRQDLPISDHFSPTSALSNIQSSNLQHNALFSFSRGAVSIASTHNNLAHAKEYSRKQISPQGPPEARRSRVIPKPQGTLQCESQTAQTTELKLTSGLYSTIQQMTPQTATDQC
jgi:hypothetical protein